MPHCPEDMQTAAVRLVVVLRSCSVPWKLFLPLYPVKLPEQSHKDVYSNAVACLCVNLAVRHMVQALFFIPVPFITVSAFVKVPVLKAHKAERFARCNVPKGFLFRNAVVENIVALVRQSKMPSVDCTSLVCLNFLFFNRPRAMIRCVDRYCFRYNSTSSKVVVKKASELYFAECVLFSRRNRSRAGT